MTLKKKRWVVIYKPIELICQSEYTFFLKEIMLPKLAK